MTTTARERELAAAALFDAAQQGGRVDLCDLSDDEECLLGAGTWAFSQAAVWENWCSQPAQERAARSEHALRALLDRGHIEPLSPFSASSPSASDTGEEVTLSLAAPLALVALARARASFLVSVIGPDDVTNVVLPYGYGIVEIGTGIRGVVMELRQGGRHSYRLLTRARAAEGLAQWAQAAVTSDDVGARCGDVLIQVWRRPDDGPVELGVVNVSARDRDYGGIAMFFDGRRYAFECQDTTSLAWAITQMMEAAGAQGAAPA